MKREYHAWHSPALGRTMELLVFGHAGEPVVTFPTSCGTFFEWEDFGMVAALGDRLEAGQVELYCLDSVDAESWYNRRVHPETRVARDDDYDRYLVHEVVPFVERRNDRPLTLAGASFGGYHVIDKGLRHPDVFAKLLSISGAYDLGWFLDGHHSLGSHLHQPLAYLPDLTDSWFLEHFRRQVILLTIGDRDFLLDHNHRLSSALASKGVPHQLDVWSGAEHDWPVWREMLRKHVGW
jgi:esterase/lipase superfamily enzyme